MILRIQALVLPINACVQRPLDVNLKPFSNRELA